MGFANENASIINTTQLTHVNPHDLIFLNAQAAIID